MKTQKFILCLDCLWEGTIRSISSIQNKYPLCPCCTYDNIIELSDYYEEDEEYLFI